MHMTMRGRCGAMALMALVVCCGTTGPGDQPAPAAGPPSHVYYFDAHSLYYHSIIPSDSFLPPLGDTLMNPIDSQMFFVKRDTLVTDPGYTFAESTFVVMGETITHNGFRVLTKSIGAEVYRKRLSFYPYAGGLTNKGVADSVNITSIDSAAGTCTVLYRSAAYSLGILDSIVFRDSAYDTTRDDRNDTLIPQPIKWIEKVVVNKALRYRGKMNVKYTQ